MVPGVKGTAVQLGVLVASVVIAFLTDVATGSLWVSIAALAICVLAGPFLVGFVTRRPFLRSRGSRVARLDQ
jgi:hypothetical protein